MNCNTSGKCEDEFLGSSSKSDSLYCMKLCQNTKSCKFSSYSEDKNQCLLFNTCYKFNKNESSYSSSKVECDLPSGGAYSPVHNSFDGVFFNILKKKSLVQKSMIPHMKAKLIFISPNSQFSILEQFKT